MDSDAASEMARLRTDVTRFRSEVSDLRHQVGRVSGLGDRVRQLEASLESLPAALEKIDRKQDALRAAFDRHREQYERDRVVQNAYNELTVAERQWRRKFGRYDEAREMAASIVDAVGGGHISRSVIVDVTTRLAIRTPRYWVAQATLAVAAWLADDPRQSGDALDYALALDHGKTALFMALVLRDQERDDVLQEWLDDYLSGLNPANLPGDFQVVIDAVTGGALGTGSAPRLVRRMNDWYAEAEGRPDIAADAIGEWQRRLLSLAEPGAGPDLSVLKASPAWPALSARLAASSAIAVAAGHFRGRFAEGADVSQDVRASLGALLRDLARTPDPVEEQYLRTIGEHRAVIESRGDFTAARAQVAAEEAGRTGTLNIVSMVSRAAFPAQDSRRSGPTVTELIGIKLSSRLIAEAANRLREELPPVGSVTVPVGERQFECVFSCADGVDRQTLRLQAAEQMRKACSEIDKEADRRQGRLRRLTRWVCPGALVAALGLGGATFIPSGIPSPELMIPAVVLGVPAIAGLGRLPQLARNARSRADREKQAVTIQINKVAGELAEFWDHDRQGAASLPELQGFLGGLTEDSVIAATRPVTSVPLPRTRKFPGWTPRAPRQRPELEGPEDLPPLSR